MKILLVSTLYQPYIVGGAEKAAAELAESFALRPGFEVVVVSLYPGNRQQVEQLNGVRVYRLPLPNLYWPFGKDQKPGLLRRLLWHSIDAWNPITAYRLGKILDAEKPDLVHTHCIAGFSVAIWHAIKKRKIRLVHTLHDYYLLCSRSSLFKNGRNCTRKCAECRLLTAHKCRASRWPDAVVSVSQYTLERHLREHYFQGVDTHVIANIHRGIPALVSPPKPGSPLVFGFIGKIEEPKGTGLLLEALSQIRAQNWRLVLAGRGLPRYLDQLRERFGDDRIEWLGFVDPAQFFSRVDTVVIPSIWGDPLPYTCMESLFAGKSILYSDAGGIQEIAHLAKHHQVFPAGNLEALKCCLEQALLNPDPWRQPVTAPSAELQRFSVQTVLDRYLAAYAKPPAD